MAMGNACFDTKIGKDEVYSKMLGIFCKNRHNYRNNIFHKTTRIAKFMGPTWGPPGSCRPQMGPVLSPWTLLSGTCPSCQSYRQGAVQNCISSVSETPNTTKKSSYKACNIHVNYRDDVAWTFLEKYRYHDDVIKWEHFPRYWPFVRGIHWSPVNSPHKGQWRGALMFSLICAWTSVWAHTRDAGDLRHHSAHYDVTAMWWMIWIRNTWRIYVSMNRLIIGSGNGLSSIAAPSHDLSQCWFVFSWTLGTNFTEILIYIQNFSFKGLNLNI